MKQPITINKVRSVHIFSTEMLEDCYFFEMEPRKYNLYSSANVLLKEDLEDGVPFSFTLGPFVWGVSDFHITPDFAHGDWESNTDGSLIPIKRPSDHDADDEGSFTAQAGGHVEGEAAASASAY